MSWYEGLRLKLLTRLTSVTQPPTWHHTEPSLVIDIIELGFSRDFSGFPGLSIIEWSRGLETDSVDTTPMCGSAPTCHNIEILWQSCDFPDFRLSGESEVVDTLDQVWFSPHFDTPTERQHVTLREPCKRMWFFLIFRLISGFFNVQINTRKSHKSKEKK